MNASAIAPMSATTFARIAVVAKAEAGLLLPEVKREMVQSRLARRLRALRLPTFDAYCDLLESDAGGVERPELVSALTTNVTRFMREPHHFEEFAREIAPSLDERAKRGERIRVWSAGCSSGEEPYSIAISAARAAPSLSGGDFKILGTDIDNRILKTARAGVYPSEAVSTAFENEAEHFFSRSGAQMTVNRSIRDQVVFNHLNLIETWPMRGPFHVIFCRNTLIYFDGPTQKRIIDGFSGLLERGGALFLGHSERVDATLDAKFERAGMTSYRRK